MSAPDSQPRNEVEQLLAELYDGQLDGEAFVRRLLGLQVFMPVRDEKHRIAGFQASSRAQPLLLGDDDGQRVLIVFSAPERGKDFLAGFPDFGGGLLVPFDWVLRRMSDGVGIALNPGLELGFDFDPDMVAMSLGLLPEAAATGASA
jgi:hypothetical protein